MGFGPTLDGVVLGSEVFTVTLGLVLMSSSNCEDSYLKVDVPEIIRVTGAFDNVETKVPNNPDEQTQLNEIALSKLALLLEAKTFDSLISTNDRVLIEFLPRFRIT